MTKEELAKELEISVHYLEHHFPRICESWRKKGIELRKIGKGKKAIYSIRKKGDLLERF